MRRINLPYFDERNEAIDSIIIHCLAYNVQDAIKSFHRDRVSAHYLIDENGKIYYLVDDKKRAWHAGKSCWKDKENLNGCSIGIELCSQSLGQQEYPFAQISALIRLCRHLKRKYHIKKDRILGHSDIAPTRKPDPGKAFPWSYLARHGLGMWYKLNNASKITVQDQTRLLGIIGYDTGNLIAAKWAFIRHYLGTRIPYDSIENLLNTPFPDTINISDEEFLNTLKAVAFSVTLLSK